MKKKGKMAACLILLVLLLAVLVVLTKKNSTADADSSSSDSGADAEKVVDFSKDDVTALSFQINGETVSFTKTAGAMIPISGHTARRMDSLWMRAR